MTVFDKTSRYADIEDASLEVAQPDGTTQAVRYKRRRFLPPRESMTVVGQHAMTDGDRLDLLATRFAGDPTAYWRLCDGNDLLRPDELERPGRVIDLTMPRP